MCKTTIDHELEDFNYYDDVDVLEDIDVDEMLKDYLPWVEPNE